MNTILIIAIIYIVILTIRLEVTIHKTKNLTEIVNTAIVMIESQEFLIKELLNPSSTLNKSLNKVKKEKTNDGQQ